MAFPGERETDPIRSAVQANFKPFATAFGFAAAMSILSLTSSFYMLEVYDRVLTSRSGETLFLLTVIAVFALSIYSWLDSLRLRLLQRAGIRVANQLSARVLRSMVASSSQNGGPVVRQGLRDVDTIRNFIGSPALAALIDAPFLTVFLIVLFYLHWAYFLLVLVGGAALISIAVADQYLTSKDSKRSITLSMKAHSFAEDGLRNADVLEGMGMSSAFVARWRTSWVDSLRLSVATADKDSRLTALSRGVRQIIQVAILGTGALLVLFYHASGGVMIAASILGGRALAPIEATVAAWKSIVAMRLARARLNDLLLLSPKRDEGMILPAPTGRLSVERAGYAAPGSRKAIIANVSFELAAGDSLGVIGPSASGKTTLTRVLIGALPCVSGTVRLDGADIYAWPRTELSPYIGYLPQDVELFGGTVRDNIARLTAADPQSVVRAAKLASAHDMILSLPNGYDTDIGDSGHKLSGGQRQRIGIARAVFGDPRFIVLDEPNSNLDAQGEEALLLTMQELKRRGVTVIIVAHRPSILANVDKILAMRDGQLENFGGRNEVLSRYTARVAPRPAANVVPMQQPVSDPAQA